MKQKKEKMMKVCKKKHYPFTGFPERLHCELLRSGLTQAELANRIGVERKSISNYIYGVSDPQASVLGKICKQLNVSADCLLFGNK